MSTEKTGPFGGLSASEAGRLSWEKRRERQAAEVAELSGPVVTSADTDSIIRKLKEKALAGDLGAARELREWIEVTRQTEGHARDQRWLEILSPKLRQAVEEEYNGGPLPASWPHERLEVER
jgi:hypothetical protein